MFGLKVSTYCNLFEKIFLSQFRDALKQSLPLSSPRAMRQIERAIYKRFGNEIYIPLYIDDQVGVIDLTSLFFTFLGFPLLKKPRPLDKVCASISVYF